jgi:hypothetical protein
MAKMDMKMESSRFKVSTKKKDERFKIKTNMGCKWIRCLEWTWANQKILKMEMNHSKWKV